MRQPAANALEYFRVARGLTIEGDVPRAVEHYLKALDHEPDFPEALVNLGILYNLLNEPTEALRCLQRAASLDPRNPRASYNLGVALAAAGEHDRAVAAFEATVHVAPLHRNALYALSVQWAKRGDRERAREYYGRYEQVVRPKAEPDTPERPRDRRVARIRFVR